MQFIFVEILRKVNILISQYQPKFQGLDQK